MPIVSIVFAAPLLLSPAIISHSAAAVTQQPLRQQLPVDERISPYASTADSVRLPDGRMLHFVCMGRGSPTVILTAGLGGDAIDWRMVQPQIAKTTRVCAWDRPGFGLSDGSPDKQTVVTTTADLETALARGSIKPPYIMVGHSLGSFESLLYTDRNRSKVVGMVLVDPSWPEESLSAPPPDERSQAGQAHLRKCAAGLRSGTIKPGGADPDNCFAFPPTYPSAWRAALSAKLSNPLQFESIASFVASSDEDRPLAFNPSRNYGDMPLIVLTAIGQHIANPSDEGQQPIALIASSADTVPDHPHDALAALSIRGVNTRIPGAGHYIQQDKPQAVIDAVDQAVAEARAAKR